MLEPGRNYSVANTDYRYGFNGKENDNDIENSVQDYGMRIYDGRLGRFLSVDKLTGKYPWFTPYQYAGNSPIATTDIDGEEYDWFTWKIAYWTAKAFIGGTNAADNFKQNINTVATNDNMGQFTSNKPSEIQQQVEQKQLNTKIARAKVYGTTANAATYASAGFGGAFVVTAAAPVLPELFTVLGSSELTPAGSYLVNKTLLAVADAGGQKLASGKVDWFDVATDYLPAKGVMGKILLGSLQASVDYQDGKLITVLNGKSLSEVSIDATSSLVVGKVFGNFDSQLEKAFIKKGVRGEELNTVLGKIIKTQKDYIESALKTAISEAAKNKLKKKK